MHSDNHRRRILRNAAGVLAGTAAALLGVGAINTAAQPAPRRIGIEARKFEYTPDQITVRVGLPVTLVLSTLDFAHGFSLPDFGVRADAVPDKTVELTFTPDKTGRFAWVCDNFCGEGHDEMSGWLSVSAA